MVQGWRRKEVRWRTVGIAVGRREVGEGGRREGWGEVRVHIKRERWVEG